MDCIYCGTELNYEDSYGNHDYICHGNVNGKSGEIYRCPNSEGFESKEDAIEYALKSDICYDDWEEIVCESSSHNVVGSFYTDKQGNLFDGYPC